MENDTALPTGETAAAGAQSNNDAAAANQNPAEQQQATEQAEGAQPNAEGEQKEPPKKEKTPEQREIERLRRRVDNLTRQKYELSARQPPAQQQNPQASETDDSVTLSRAELNRMVAEHAQKLAPTISEQRAEIERRQGVVDSLAKSWGQQEFDAKASELDEVFGGLADAQGRPKPATDAIFDADDPKAVIEYLTDPDNADEAERIARLPATRAGREIARIEAKLEQAKKEAKPKPSNAAKPLEAVKGGGVVNGMPDPSNTKAYIAWANAQERAR